MVNCLKPIRLAVEALSNHDTNLLTCEEIFKFLFSNLEKQNFALSNMLFKEIRNLLLKRRKNLVFLITRTVGNRYIIAVKVRHGPPLEVSRNGTCCIGEALLFPS
jgi:hypothetical protein